MSLATFYLVYSSSSRTNGRRVKYNNDLILEIQSIKRHLGSVMASYHWQTCRNLTMKDNGEGDGTETRDLEDVSSHVSKPPNRHLDKYVPLDRS